MLRFFQYKIKPNCTHWAFKRGSDTGFNHNPKAKLQNRKQATICHVSYCPKYAGLVTLLPPHLLLHTPLKVRYLSVFAVSLHERKRRCAEQPVSMAMRRRSSSEIRSALTEAKGEKFIRKGETGGGGGACGAGFGQAHLWH